MRIFLLAGFEQIITMLNYILAVCSAGFCTKTSIAIENNSSVGIKPFVISEVIMLHIISLVLVCELPASNHN